jgi:4-amino-4-deoxy-L-arabinose transferase-like glycosyltransferase
VKSATPIDREQGTKAGVGLYALLFVGCVLFHIAGTWTLPLIDRDEPRFAEASREMVERSDYIVPYFNNHFRFDKPPLAYWAQIASYKIFGENDFAARFPSAIAAALIALSLLAWGSRLRVASASQARLGGNRVGWWAAIIFTLSLQTFLHAKAAVADMWLVLFMTLAYWAGFELIFGKQTFNAQLRKLSPAGGSTSNAQWKWWAIFYFSLALGFLAKGPIALIPLLLVAATKLQDPQLQLAKPFAFVRGIAVTSAIIALWGVPALIQTRGEFFRVGIIHHVVGRSFSTMEGHGSNSFGMCLLLLPFYFVTVFLSFFPWSIKLPRLIRQLCGRQESGVSDRGYSGRDKTDNYLIVGAILIFIIFTLVKTKLPHYTLPAFPLLALLLARMFTAENSTRFFRSCAIASALLYLAIALIAAPLAARSFPAYALFQESRDYLRPEMEFGAVDYSEPSLVWYFRARAKGFFTPLKKNSAPDFMSKAGSRFVIVPTSLAETLFPSRPENWKIFSSQGFNIVKGKQVDLTLLLKSE